MSFGETDESIQIGLWASVQSNDGSRGVRISGSIAGYTMFQGSVKGTGYPMHSPVSPSLPSHASPCAITFQLQSTGVNCNTVIVSPQYKHLHLQHSKCILPRTCGLCSHIPTSVLCNPDLVCQSSVQCPICVNLTNSWSHLLMLFQPKVKLVLHTTKAYVGMEVWLHLLYSSR